MGLLTDGPTRTDAAGPCRSWCTCVWNTVSEPAHTYGVKGEVKSSSRATMEAVMRRQRTSLAEDWRVELGNAGSRAQSHKEGEYGRRAVNAMVSAPDVPSPYSASCSLPIVAMCKSSAIDCLPPPRLTASTGTRERLSYLLAGLLTYGAMLLVVGCDASRSCCCERRI